MNTPTLETDRLLLRPFASDDASEVFECWESDPDVAKYMFWTAHNDPSKTKAWIAFEIGQIPKDDWYRFAIVLKETNTLIGTALIYYEEEVSCWEIAYNFGKKYWNRGYATESLKRVLEFGMTKLRIPEIVGRYATENPASGNVLKKLGFLYEKDIPYECNDGSVKREGIQCRFLKQLAENKFLYDGYHSFLQRKKAEMGETSPEFLAFEKSFANDFYCGVKNDTTDRNVLIEGDRLVIRKAHIADADFMCSVELNEDNSPWVANWPLGWRVARFGDPDFLQVILELKDGTPIGFIIFRDMLTKEHAVQLKRIAIIDKGKGYGKEALHLAQKLAFDIFCTKRLYLSTKLENLRAQSIYKATGFTPEMPDPCNCFHMDLADYKEKLAIRKENFMTKSKEWDWKNAEQKKWMTPSEDSVYLAVKWADEGARSILDLGCGLGRHSIFFTENGFKVTAVDLSEDAIRLTKERMKEKQVDFLCHVADMVALPFANDAFDRVFSYHVISHQDTAGVQKVIDEITRVLKPGGKVFLTLCSKEHYAFSDSSFPHIDANTVLKTEGAEVEVPHFFADKHTLNSLFHNYKFEHVRHITDCVMEEDDSKERSHYFIEATVQKTATKPDYSNIIGSTVECTIDRPLGSFHPRHKDLYYPINYGYVKHVLAGDGAEQDVYILGEDTPLSTFTGKVIAVYHRYNDVEDKWIVAAAGRNFSDEEILRQIDFQEKFFDGILMRS